MDFTVMLRGHKGPRRYARPMISPLGFRMVRRDGRVHSLSRFHIGGSAYFCMGASAQCRRDCPKARTGSSLHDHFDHNVSAICVVVRWG
jgi:hypothetical protein